MTTPLTPETSRRIEEKAKQYAGDFSGNPGCKIDPALIADVFVEFAEEILTELAQSQGDGKGDASTDPSRAEILATAKRDFSDGITVETVVLDAIRTAAKSLESQLSALKAELEEAKSEQPSYLQDILLDRDQEIDRLRSELEQARAERDADRAASSMLLRSSSQKIESMEWLWDKCRSILLPLADPGINTPDNEALRKELSEVIERHTYARQLKQEKKDEPEN